METTKNQTANHESLVTLDDFVFENKNHEYGAFVLRRSYSKVLNRAFYYGTAAFLLTLFASDIYAKREKRAKDVDGKITLVNVLAPPPKSEPIIELPPPPEEQPQPNTIRNLPPTIVETPLVEEDPIPTQEQLKDTPSGVETHIDPNATIAAVIDETPKTVEPVEIKPEEPEIFIALEQHASYLGGWAEMSKFLAKNLKYPRQASSAGISGKVFLSFIVERNGEISDVKVEKGIGFNCDEEAVRVVKLMPRWTPGKQSGRAVKSRFNLPIAFVLE
jgi:periplasmic protein TonB